MKMLFVGVAAACAAFAQDAAPAVDQAALMNLRFYEANGGFLIEQVPGANLPDGEVSFEVSGPTNQTVALRRQPMGDFAGYTILLPNGPGVVRLGKAGKYEFQIKAGGRVVGQLGFTMEQKNGHFLRSGDWGRLGYFAQNARDSSSPMGFHFWASLSELPVPKPRSMLTVHLMAGAREVGTTPSAVVVSLNEWQPFRVELVQPKAAGGKYLTAAMLGNGLYMVVIKADGHPLKSYRAEVKGGKLTGIPSTPSQRVDTSSGSNSSWKLMDTAWVSAR